MSTNAAQSLISSAQIYKPELYQAAAKDSSCTDQEISVESTNVVVQILEETVIRPLSQIPTLAQQVDKRIIDTDTSKKIEGIFRTIGITPSKEKGPSLEEERHDLALRTANLFKYKYQLQLRALLLYLSCFKKFSREEALQSILGNWSGGSLSDAVGNKAIDVFKADIEIQKERQTAAEKRSAEARAESAKARAESAEAKKTIARERIRQEGYDGVLRLMDKMKKEGLHFPKGYQVRLPEGYHVP